MGVCRGHRESFGGGVGGNRGRPLGGVAAVSHAGVSLVGGDGVVAGGDCFDCGKCGACEGGVGDDRPEFGRSGGECAHRRWFRDRAGWWFRGFGDDNLCGEHWGDGGNPGVFHRGLLGGGAHGGGVGVCAEVRGADFHDSGRGVRRCGPRALRFDWHAGGANLAGQ